MAIKCLIIDDEPLARKRLFNLISNINELVCIGESSTGKDAINKIKDCKPDLIFLDIQMKDMTGFDVLNKIESDDKPLVIFVTAYDKYALKAFDYFAIDYLLKPYKKKRFEKAICRIMSFMKNKTKKQFDDSLSVFLEHIKEIKPKIDGVELKKRLPVKTGKSVVFIDIENIKYILASGSYIDIHCEDKKFVLRSSLNEILKNLSNQQFCRIHRSTIINVDYIYKLITSNFGETDVKMTDDNLLRVSQSYKKEFLKLMGI